MNMRPPRTIATRARERARGPVKEVSRFRAARSQGDCAAAVRVHPIRMTAVADPAGKGSGCVRFVRVGVMVFLHAPALGAGRAGGRLGVVERGVSAVGDSVGRETEVVTRYALLLRLRLCIR
jgi:hypothetical protein